MGMLSLMGKQQKKNDRRQSQGLLAWPVRRLLFAGFVLVAVLPISLLGVKLYNVAWDEAWREIAEKHQLLAQNLASPISVYIKDQRISLEQLGELVAYVGADSDMQMTKKQEDFVLESMARLQGFRSVSLVNLSGDVLMSTRDISLHEKKGVFKQEKCFVKARAEDRWVLSGIKKSPFDDRPSLVMSSPVRDAEGKQLAVMMAELRIDLIEKLRKQIKFGKKGHSAIVDNFGRAIAHPNPDWMKSMRDLSPLPIVQKMMSGQTGVTEFYSPFIRENMVAGYTSVPGIKWGIMVPQPKSEIEAHVNRILHAQFVWALIGLSLALLVAWLLTRWLTAPMKRLCVSATEIAENDFQGNLPELSGLVPREVGFIRDRFVGVVNGLQEARSELDELNQSLQRRVSDATQELRGANRQLQVFASQDYLTKVFNRRYFESTLLQRISAKDELSNHFCLMMVDVDNFKPINDHYGHAAGDRILIQLANLLKEHLGEGHLIARYGGDQFVVLLNDELADPRQEAHDIIEAVKQTTFGWQGEYIRVTLSIGMIYQHSGQSCTLDTLMHGADQALLKAKEMTSDKVSVITG